MATGKVQIDEGATTNLATNTITEDAVTKHINRSILNNSSGTEIDTNSGNKSAATLRVVLATDQPALTNKLLVTPDLPSGASTSAKQDTGNTSLASIDGKITAVNTGAVVVASGSITADTELTTADLDTGAGTDTRAVVGLVGAKSGGGVLIPGDATKGLAVDLSATGANTNKLLVTPDLPSGASTAAKQPALGTAGTASSDVITVQGIASMTKLLVTPDSVALPANQSINVSQINAHTALEGGSNGSLAVGGTVAHDGVDAQYPVKIGGKFTSSPAKVSASGDVVDLSVTQDGRLLKLTESTDSFNINNNYSSAQTNTSIQSAPGANKRLVVTKIIYSRDTAGNMKLVEDPAGTPATKFGPHYFPATGGMVAVDMYVPLTTNKALGITTVGGGNETISIYGITENV